MIFASAGIQTPVEAYTLPSNIPLHICFCPYEKAEVSCGSLVVVVRPYKLYQRTFHSIPHYSLDLGYFYIVSVFFLHSLFICGLFYDAVNLRRIYSVEWCDYSGVMTHKRFGTEPFRPN